jgi:TolB protein
MNADGSAVTVIRADEGAGDYSKWEPSWSSVGSKIVYVEGNGESSGGIWSMSSAGAGAHALTPYGGDTNIDSAPDWSPSATKIAFQRYVDCSGGSCKNAVYVMNANGTGAHLVKKGASFPSWSPAGNKIAFVRRMGGSTEIFSMNTNGSSLKRLTNNGASDFSPDWAPSP